MVDRPDGLFQSIEKDPNSKYEKINLDYTCSSIKRLLGNRPTIW